FIGFAVDQYNPYSNIYWAEIDEETGDAEIESLHGQIPNGGYYIRNIQQLPDGNVVLSGDFLEDNSFFVLKMTPDAEVEWYRRVHVYDDFINIGPSLNVFFFKDLRFHEGEYLITGRSWIHSSTDPLASGHYTVLIKLDEFGCLEPGCQYAV